MAEQTAERVLVDAFGAARGVSLTDALAAAGRQIDGLRTVNEVLAEALGTNTQAVVENSTSKSGVAAEVGKTAANVFTSGLGLAPLFTSLFKLFREGDRTEEPSPLIRYALPESLRVEAGNGSLANGAGGLPGVDYSQNGLPRVVERGFAPQITVQVQAMDSRSFLDHSDDIARAVRDAMLNMHSLNDVVSDL